MFSSTAVNLHNWLAVHHTAGIGAATFHKFLQLDPVLNHIPNALKPNWHGVEADMAWLQRTPDAKIITLLDDSYPRLLKNISYPPPVLYLLGDPRCLAIPQIAMVGSRNPTSIGLQQAEQFARDLVNLGYIITSGLALGIDGASHKGALSIKDGRTIAVLGNGLDMVYPSRHKTLASQIAGHGCLVSEFPIGSQPLAHHFPRRNRIISGLSLGVLVVEAALNSGSLITARLAGEQGREVFAIPGAIHNIKAKGCHELIRQGAKLVDCAEDVLEELGVLMKYVNSVKTAPAGQIKLVKVQLSEMQELLLNKIDYESTCVDVIVRRSGLAIGTVGAMLLELELHGLVIPVPGGYARRLGAVTIN